MVTGSHNPPDHNGFKLVLGGKAFFGDAIQKLGAMARRLGPPAGPRGRVEEHSVFADYVARLARDYDAAARPQGRLGLRQRRHRRGRRRAGARRCRAGTSLLNETIDGTFPAHHPDPTVPENLVQLQQAVAADELRPRHRLRRRRRPHRRRRREGPHLVGRPAAADPGARRAEPQPGAPILADVKSSQVLFDEIARAGGKPVMMATGHSLIKAGLAETGAPLAGEMSGHIFFAERYYGFDDAVYVAVRLLDILARAGQSLDDARRVAAGLQHPELRIDCVS